MNGMLLLLGALLCAAPCFSQQSRWTDPRIESGRFEWLRLLESESEVREQLGQPPLAGDFGVYRSWQYRFDAELDHDDFSHALVFRKSDGRLVSVSRTYAQPRLIDEWFPRQETVVCSLPAPGGLDFRVRVRRMAGGALLMAPGSGEWGKPAQQIILIHESVMPRFYPELAERLSRPSESR